MWGALAPLPRTVYDFVPFKIGSVKYLKGYPEPLKRPCWLAMLPLLLRVLGFTYGAALQDPSKFSFMLAFSIVNLMRKYSGRLQKAVCWKSQKGASADDGHYGQVFSLDENLYL